jgi:hypothetical protein
MSRFLLALCLVTSISVAQERAPASPPAPPAKVVPSAPAEGKPSEKRELNAAKRDELGMVFGVLRTTLKELQDSGTITDDTSDSEAAFLIVAKIRRANRKAFDAGGYNWEACLRISEIFYSELRE